MIRALGSLQLRAEANRLRFERVKTPGKAELEALVRTLSERVGRHLERAGLLVRDLDSSYLALEPDDDDGLAQVLGSSITYRIAMGARQGHKAFTLQTLPVHGEPARTSDRLAKASGFSLHAGVAVEPRERNKLERLCRTITRPALSEQRLSLTSQGLVRYALKTPYRDGATHVFFEPLNLMARLAVLIPKPGSTSSVTTASSHRTVRTASRRPPRAAVEKRVFSVRWLGCWQGHEFLR